MEITAWLERFVAEQRALAGAVYARATTRRQADDMLTLLAACNLDPHTVEVASSVQRGQGLAGLAFERKATLSTCTGRRSVTPDLSALFEGMLPQQAAVALPLEDAAGEVRALVYLLFPTDRRLRDDELIQMVDRAGHVLVRVPPAAGAATPGRRPAMPVRHGPAASRPTSTAGASATTTSSSWPIIA